MLQTTLILTILFVTSYGSLNASNGLGIFRRILEDCQKKPSISKCFKIHILKATERAFTLEKLNLYNGINIVKSINGNRTSRLLKAPLDLTSLDTMKEEVINKLLLDSIDNFLGSHQLELSVPKDVSTGRLRRKNRYFWGIIAALAIKTMIMTMSYKGVAAMSGAALILGKMALVLSAILGLKKLIGGEKTTFEIVKHPHHSQSHSYSSSYDESEGNQYHRSYIQPDESYYDKAYSAQIPKYR